MAAMDKIIRTIKVGAPSVAVTTQTHSQHVERHVMVYRINIQ